MSKDKDNRVKRIKVDDTRRIGVKVLSSTVNSGDWVVEAVIIEGDKQTNTKIEVRLPLKEVVDNERKVLKHRFDIIIADYIGSKNAHQHKDWEYFQDG